MGARPRRRAKCERSLSTYFVRRFGTTGSKEHNVACRQRALDRGWTINEYGIFREEDDERVGGEEESEIYERLDMDWVPPELREDRGEIEAAAQGELPELIEVDDVRGELHAHTTATDGREDLETMVEATRKWDYEYLGITDHSQAMTVANGLDPGRLREQMAAIEDLDERYDDVRILKGCEVDILEDGSLDLPGDVLEDLDYTICSIHSTFGLEREAQTERIVQAIEHPECDVVGHLTGRMIGGREGYELDLERIFEVAEREDVVFEINGQPRRLDLRDVHVRQAKKQGLEMVVTTDAHRTEHLDYVRFAVDQARRGWLEADDVVNTRTVDDLLARFE